MNIIRAFKLLRSGKAKSITCDSLKLLNSAITLGNCVHAYEVIPINKNDPYFIVWDTQTDDALSKTWEVVE